MSPMSKSKTKSKDMTTSGAVKEQMKDSIKTALSTSAVNGTVDGFASAIPGNGSAYVAPVNKKQQPLRLNHTNGSSDRLLQPPASNILISNAPATSVLLWPSPIVVDARRSNVGNGSNNVQQALTREPLVMMQHPQSISTKQNLLQATCISLSERGAGQYHDNIIPGYESLSTSGNAYLRRFCSCSGF